MRAELRAELRERERERERAKGGGGESMEQDYESRVVSIVSLVGLFCL
jgi:hypothetical protein